MKKDDCEKKSWAGLRFLIEKEYGNIAAMAVMSKGELVWEECFHGAAAEDPVHVASVTKSVLSALVGIAVKKGLIEGVEQRVLDFFPEFEACEGGVKGRITIRHLLSMTAPYRFEPWKEPLERLCKSSDWVKYTLDLLDEEGDLGSFQYATAGAHLLSALLTRSTGKNARDFANEQLFQPLGMRTIPVHDMLGFGFDDLFGKDVRGWVEDLAGNSTGGWGLTMTARDMARFGQLYLEKGIRKGEEILPTGWVDETTAMNEAHYGYLWWLFEEDGFFAYAAMGDGGNMICCVPQMELVVAIASHFMMNPADRWPLILDHVMPILKEKEECV